MVPTYFAQNYSYRARSYCDPTLLLQHDNVTNPFAMEVQISSEAAPLLATWPPRQLCCGCACQISKRCDNSNNQSHWFRTSRDLMIRCLMRCWNEAQIADVMLQTHFLLCLLSWRHVILCTTAWKLTPSAEKPPRRSTLSRMDSGDPWDLALSGDSTLLKCEGQLVDGRTDGSSFTLERDKNTFMV